jgi:branched-chain amino acid transport system substrate-binding protein
MNTCFLRQCQRAVVLAMVPVLGLLSAQVMAQEPLRIGAILPLTGSLGTFGPGQAAALKIAADEVNANGGVLGLPVTLNVEDDETNSTAGVNAARKLVEINGAKVLLGTLSSSVTLPVLAYASPLGIPVMTVSGAPEISEVGRRTKLAYRYVVTERKLAEVYAVVARRAGYKRAAVIAFNNAAQAAGAESFAQRFQREGGEFLGTVVIEGGRSSYRAELTKVLAGKPDLIVLGAYQGDAIILAKEIFQLGENVAMIGPAYALNDAFVKAVGTSVSEGINVVDVTPNLDSSTYKRFAQSYRTALGKDPVNNPYAVAAYDMLVVTALAAEAAKSTDPKVFVPFIRTVSGPPGEKVDSYAAGVRALRAGRKIYFEGASSPLDFDDAGDIRTMRFAALKIKAGVPVLQAPVAP